MDSIFIAFSFGRWGLKVYGSSSFDNLFSTNKSIESLLIFLGLFPSKSREVEPLIALILSDPIRFTGDFYMLGSPSSI
jgi:hypothetical protein